MKKVLKKLILCILVIYIILYLTASKILLVPTYATENILNPLNNKQPEQVARTGHTQAEAGETIAAWCIDFWKKHKNQCEYNVYARERSYSLDVRDDDVTTTYGFDCVGFVSFALHHALGIGGAGFTCAAVPEFYNASGGRNEPWGAYWRELNPNNESVVQGNYKGIPVPMDKMQPGDVVFMGHHVEIYVGDGKSIGMCRDQHGNSLLSFGPVEEACKYNSGYAGLVARVNSVAAKEAMFKYMAGSAKSTLLDDMSNLSLFSMKGNMVSNCSQNENKGANGGQPGDQTQAEYRVREWYDFSQQYILRYPDENVARTIAQISIRAANNDSIGYCQEHRLTYFEELKNNNYEPEKISTPCEADCSSATAANIIAAGVKLKNDKLSKLSPDLWTGNMKSELEAVGFKALSDPKYLTGPEELLAGDVILNETTHVCIFVGNGEMVYQNFQPEVDDISVDLDEQQFSFTGTPKTVMYEGYHKNGFWVFDLIGDFIDFIVGVIVSGIKTSILGYVETAQGAIDGAIKFLDGNDERPEPINIEDVIFNRISIFDVNIFNDTAGGEELKENSTVDILRKVIVIWYIALRNVAFVVLVILIVYYGIRLAIATIADEKKNYKKILIAWVKSFILLLILHVLMNIILNFNDFFVGNLETIGAESKIYNTIRTRTYDAAWRISFFALILYITLIVMLVRFIWVYLKRTFAVMFLIILSPLVIGRYAIEGASGKASDMATNWFKKFLTAVFLQSVHAMTYVIFVGPVLVHSLDSLLAFTIALFFLNFMLEVDQIFTNIFKFNLAPDDAKDLENKFSIKDHLGEVIAARRLGGMAFGFAKGVGSFAVHTTGTVARRGYRSIMNRANLATGGQAERDFDNARNQLFDNLDENVYGRFNDFVQRHTNPTSPTILNRLPVISGVRRAANRGATVGNSLLKVRKLSRRKGKTKAYANKYIKLRVGEYGRRFTAKFKVVKDVVVGTGEVILAVPMTVVEPGIGIAFAFDAISKPAGVKKGYEKAEKTKEKMEISLTNTIESLNDVEDRAERIEQDIGTMNATLRDDTIEKLKRISDSEINSYMVDAIIMQYTNDNRIDTIDASNIDNVVDNAVEQLSDTLSQTEKQAIKTRAVQIFNQGPNSAQNSFNRNAQDEFKFIDVIESIQDATMETVMGTTDSRFINLAMDVNGIENDNARETYANSGDGEILNVNRFLDSLKI